MSIIIYLLLIILPFSTSLSFRFTLISQQHQCFQESFPLQTNVVGKIKDVERTKSNFIFTINRPNEQKIILQKHLREEGEEESEVAFGFITSNDMVEKYSFCFLSTHPEPIIFDFTLNSGLDAKDYSNLAKKMNLKPVEENVIKVDDYIKKIKKTQEEIWVQDSHKLELSRDFNRNLSWVSFFSILVVVSFGAFEYFIMRNYFKQKKMI